MIKEVINDTKSNFRYIIKKGDQYFISDPPKNALIMIPVFHSVALGHVPPIDGFSN